MTPFIFLPFLFNSNSFSFRYRLFEFLPLFHLYFSLFLFVCFWIFFSVINFPLFSFFFYSLWFSLPLSKISSFSFAFQFSFIPHRLIKITPCSTPSWFSSYTFSRLFKLSSFSYTLLFFYFILFIFCFEFLRFFFFLSASMIFSLFFHSCP